MKAPDDVERFARFLTDHQSNLYAFIMSLTASGPAAADILQETNRALLEHRGDFDGEREFLPWALTFARHQVLAFRQKRVRERMTFDDDVFERIAARAQERAAGHGSRLSALSDCLEKLPADDRRTVERHYAGGESVEEIARATTRPAGSVAVRLFRLRKALADCVERRVKPGGVA